jgi:hypothetical protein
MAPLHLCAVNANEEGYQALRCSLYDSTKINGWITGHTHRHTRAHTPRAHLDTDDSVSTRNELAS